MDNKKMDPIVVLEGRIPPKDKKTNRKSRRGPGEDRYFGRFKCKKCHKMWESAHVYTIAGTMKVKYKQRCKNCSGDDAWVFPYDLQMILCNLCQEPSIYCKCLCEDCDRLWYRPRGTAIENEDDYCRCDRRNAKNNQLGDKIDAKKPHERALCQRCSTTGRPCWGRSRFADDEEDGGGGGGGGGYEKFEE